MRTTTGAAGCAGSGETGAVREAIALRGGSGSEKGAALIRVAEKRDLVTENGLAKMAGVLKSYKRERAGNGVGAGWRGRTASVRRLRGLELLEVALLDLLHQGFAAEEIALQLGGDLAGHDEELVARHF